jgi:hypothetical protein
LLAILFTASSAVLGGMSACLVTSVCILCLATYAANLLFLLCSLMACRGMGVRRALAEPLRTLRERTGRITI